MARGGPVITGTRQAKRSQILKSQGPADLRKLRCKKDNELVVGTPDGKGGIKYLCPVCKTEYKSVSMG